MSKRHTSPRTPIVTFHSTDQSVSGGNRLLAELFAALGREATLQPWRELSGGVGSDTTQRSTQMPPETPLSPIKVAHATLNAPGAHLTQPSTSEPVTALAITAGDTRMDRRAVDLPRLLSTTDVAEWTGRSERTVRGWARAGLLQKRRIGRGTFYLAAEVLGLLEGSRDGGKIE